MSLAHPIKLLEEIRAVTFSNGSTKTFVIRDPAISHLFLAQIRNTKSLSLSGVSQRAMIFCVLSLNSAFQSTCHLNNRSLKGTLHKSRL